MPANLRDYAQRVKVWKQQDDAVYKKIQGLITEIEGLQETYNKLLLEADETTIVIDKLQFGAVINAASKRADYKNKLFQCITNLPKQKDEHIKHPCL
jgi:hypothetical protein